MYCVYKSTPLTKTLAPTLQGHCVLIRYLDVYGSTTQRENILRSLLFRELYTYMCNVVGWRK